MLLAGHFPLVFWAFSGMETGLCLLLMTVQDLKRYFPNNDYRYEILVVPTGWHALYARNSGLAHR